MEAIVLYDGDCGFCTWAAGALVAWGGRGRLRAVAIQDAAAGGILQGMTTEARMSSWHLATADGHLYSAGAAAEQLFRVLPGAAPLAWLAHAFAGATERTYRLIARHRGLLGRMLGVRGRRRFGPSL